MNKVLSALSNPKVQRILLYVAIAIIILIILSKSSDAFRGLLRGIGGAKGDDPYAPITDLRKTYLEGLATDINTDVYAWLVTADEQEGNLMAANALNDSEFRYLNNWYNKTFDESLYDDVDWEFLWYTDADEDLLARIDRMSLTK